MENAARIRRIQDVASEAFADLKALYSSDEDAERDPLALDVIEKAISSIPQWEPIETAPNNVFDVLAKCWDAPMDRFMYRRFANCVKVNDEIVAEFGEHQVRLMQHGYRPTHWMDIPDMPPELKENP